jgi:hypothetical protein
MDEMDPEMAAALAASMMDAPAGAVGGSFGGGGVPMMTEASSPAALEALAAVQSAVLGGGEPGEMGALLDQCRDAYETKKWHELTNLLGQAYKLDVWDASAANRASLVQLCALPPPPCFPRRPAAGALLLRRPCPSRRSTMRKRRAKQLVNTQAVSLTVRGGVGTCRTGTTTSSSPSGRR